MGIESDYKSLMVSLQKVSDIEKIIGVNSFFNNAIAYMPDIEAYFVSDYWATLQETIRNGFGDCDDIAIAKYTSLKNLGVEDVKLAYVQANGSGAHMVCKVGSLILDNIQQTISTVDERYDLTIIFTFDDTHLMIRDKCLSAKDNLSKWRDLLDRENNTKIS